jgi:DNA modification methylase
MLICIQKAVACEQTNRKARVIEYDPKYCDVIVKRMIKLDPTLIIKRNGVVTKDFE